MAYTGKKPVDFVDVTQSQSMTVSDDLTVNNDTTVAGDLTVDTNTLYVDSANNRVGIGTSSPSEVLHVDGQSDGQSGYFQSSGASFTELNLLAGTDSADLVRIRADSSSNLSFFTNNSGQRMVIDSSGNVLVGKIATSIGTAGVELRTNGSIFTRDSGSPLFINRTTSDGAFIDFRKDNTTVGSIGTISGVSYIQGTSTGSGLSFGSLTVYPMKSGAFSDNQVDLGSASYRFDDVYATNGTIQTSDRNEKQDIEELSEAEKRVAVACKGLMRKFRWRDAVAEKGDDARIHFGIIAQDLQDAFAAEGLDAGRYAMFISSTWWEAQTEVPEVEADEENGIEAQDAYTRTDTFETAEEAPEGAVERTRLGVRYPELLAFIIGAM
jgi:hypothetical protein